MKTFHSRNLAEAQQYLANAESLLAESRISEDPLLVIKNRKATVYDAELEVEYFATSVLFEGTSLWRDDELWLKSGDETVILEPGDPISIFFAGQWLEGFLGREPQGQQNFYFLSPEVSYIGLSYQEKVLERCIRTYVQSEIEAS